MAEEQKCTCCGESKKINSVNFYKSYSVIFKSTYENRMCICKDCVIELAEQFKKRFTQENQGFKDNNTGKIHFCIHDLGFKITQEECLEVRNCKSCLNEANDYLKFRDEQRRLVEKIE